MMVLVLFAAGFLFCLIMEATRTKKKPAIAQFNLTVMRAGANVVLRVNDQVHEMNVGDGLTLKATLKG